ncbi:MAG: hypothetical protein ACI9NY_000191 [Kiritimatiellia bacterium]|jgi:hypothetical protein
MNPISFSVLGIGAWGPGFSDWRALAELMGSQSSEPVLQDNYRKGPKPQIIPANERRRAPVAVRLAVESSWQAVNNAHISAKDLACVFASGYGDTQLTDYMCRALNTESKQLSPTKFHNSVHNAAAGYWTISTDCHAPANSIAGLEWSVPLALLDAVIQSEQEHRPLLITCFDADVALIMRSIMDNDFLFSSSIVVTTEKINHAPQFTLELVQQACDWPTVEFNRPLLSLYRDNPSAKRLALLSLISLPTEHSTQTGSSSIDLPINEHSFIRITKTCENNL